MAAPAPAHNYTEDSIKSLDWREHINVHLPLYLATGQLNSGCPYCQQIAIFDDPAFRQGGVAWLSQNSYLCTLPSNGGGGGRGGGTHRGH